METYFDLISDELTAHILYYVADIDDVNNFDLAFDPNDNVYKVASYLSLPQSFYLWKEILDDFPKFIWWDVYNTKLHLETLSKMYPVYNWKNNTEKIDQRTISKIRPLDEDIIDQLNSDIGFITYLAPGPDDNDPSVELEKILYAKIGFPDEIYQMMKNNPNDLNYIYNITIAFYDIQYDVSDVLLDNFKIDDLIFENINKILKIDIREFLPIKRTLKVYKKINPDLYDRLIFHINLFKTF